MGLSSAYSAATAAIAARQAEMSSTSRNIANAGNAAATRKTTKISADADGDASVDGVSRATNAAFFADMATATANEARDRTRLDKLDVLQDTIGDPEDDSSVAARIGDLVADLDHLAADPSDHDRAEDVVASARDVAKALTDGYEAVLQMQEDCDAEMGDCVDGMNALLKRFEALNTAIVSGTAKGEDVTDLEDQRDAVLVSLSEIVGVSTLARGNNDVVLYTDSGVVLFETTARTVSMARTETYQTGTTGAAVMVDGVAITGPDAAAAVGGGRLAALASVRDVGCPTYLDKLDEVARGLVETFAETAAGNPDRAGLFTWSGGPAVPPTGTLVHGIAATIAVNAAVDPANHGDPMLLRDGGINGSAYRSNTSGAADFDDRLDALVKSVKTARSFDPEAGTKTNATILDYATSVISWLEDKRRSASDAADTNEVTLANAATAYSNKTGINIDTELQAMLQIENAYGAAAKLLAAVDTLYDTLIASVD